MSRVTNSTAGSDSGRRSRKRLVAYLIGTWFGCGYAPVGPGTAGSLAALALAYALHTYAGSGQLTFLLLAAAVLLPGIWAAGAVAQSEQRKDPGLVVVDEVIGQWIALAGASTVSWKTWLAAFLLFRAFDIWKPPPVRQLEHLSGGLGIVADDVMAGIYGALGIFVLDRLRFL